MNKVLQQTVLLIGLMLSTLVVASPKYPIHEPIGGETFGHSVKQVSDGVYVFRWWVYRNIFIVTDEGVIVTDPMNPKAANLLMGEIRKITDKPVKYVVYSHNHHDHISGGTIFKADGAKFVGHENIVKELGDHPSPVTPLPDITFTDTYSLKLGGRTLELTYLGPNHGESLVVMTLPDEKIMFIVDIVTPRRVAFRTMPDFWPDEWVRSLKEIEEIFQLAIRELPEKHRTALLLYKQQQLSYQEIAEVMKAKENAVKTWIHRGRTQLKKEMEALQ